MENTVYNHKPNQYHNLTFNMRSKELTKIEKDRPTVLLLNGGGQQPYNKFHKATKLFNSYDCNIVSLELPGHGKSGFDHVVSTEEMLEKFYQDLVEICNNYHQVGLFGFSLGALLSLKALENKIYPFEFIITLGAGLHISSKEEEIMQKYASVEFFEEMRWMPIMIKYHGESWKYLLKSISPMLRVGSELFVDTDTFRSNSSLHLIIGDNDGVVDHRLQSPFAERENISLHILSETAHFDYFTKSWSKLKEVVGDILAEYLSPK